jgi:hypothetical protein
MADSDIIVSLHLVIPFISMISHQPEKTHIIAEITNAIDGIEKCKQRG